VFVNVPYDDDFLPLLHAIVFAIHDCGFIARIAVEDTGSNETRLDKIVRIIRESRFSIHDISRVALTASSPLPRFNMAFECGLALGAIRYGAMPGRDFLFMSAEPFQDRQTLSDLAGQDAKAHRNDPRTVVGAVRAFLAAKNGALRTRGADMIWQRYERFTAHLPRLAATFELSPAEIAGFDYLRDFVQIVARWIEADAMKLAARGRGQGQPAA